MSKKQIQQIERGQLIAQGPKYGIYLHNDLDLYLDIVGSPALRNELVELLGLRIHNDIIRQSTGIEFDHVPGPTHWRELIAYIKNGRDVAIIPMRLPLDEPEYEMRRPAYCDTKRTTPLGLALVMSACAGSAINIYQAYSHQRGRSSIVQVGFWEIGPEESANRYHLARELAALVGDEQAPHVFEILD